MTRKIIIIAHALAGKTTAHHRGLGVDPEEASVYKTIKSGWGRPELAADPEWRQQVRGAYCALRDWCINFGHDEVLLVHPVTRTTLEGWLAAGHSVRCVVTAQSEFDRRVQGWVDHCINTGKAPDLLEARLTGAREGRRQIEALTGVLPGAAKNVWRTIEAAIADARSGVVS